MSDPDGKDVDITEGEQIVRRLGKRTDQGALSRLVGSYRAAGARSAAPVKLDELLEEWDLVQYLLQSNTFFHGKIGFYKPLLARIYQAAEVNAEQVEYINREEDLVSRKRSDSPPLERITVLPIVESEDALNRLVALALRKVKPVWLIAPLFSVQKHLLIAFSNFFITGTLEELDALRDIFQLESDSFEGVVFPGRTHGFLITDHEVAAGSRETTGLSIIPLDYPELPIVRRIPRSRATF